MKFLFAPDSFKGSLTANEVCGILTDAAKIIIPECECVSLPVADGGEGMTDALLSACGGRKIKCSVHDPLGRVTDAEYAILSDNTAAIETAAAAGLSLLEESERDPLKTTTYGVGELILDAAARGCKKIILGLGGSSTNDGGMGIGSALGIAYLDKNGRELYGCGDNAENVADMDISRMKDVCGDLEILLACDVKNPLCGVDGASRVFGPQKGADGETSVRLDSGLLSLEKVTEKVLAREYNKKIRLGEICGMGAAGGMALPLVAFLNAKIESGIDIMLDAMHFDKAAADADIIFTGEGCTDAQTLMGKVPLGVGRRAKKLGKPVILVSGCLESGCKPLNNEGISAFFSCSVFDKDKSWNINHAAENLDFCARQIFTAIKFGKNI